jgi:hypothetical protein
MKNSIENIRQKLNLYGFRFYERENSSGESVLKIYLPMLCYLKITFSENRIKISSRTFIGLDFLSLEWNFMLYALALALLLAFQVFDVGSAFTIFFLLFLLFFCMGIIKLEFLKTQVYKWLDELNDQTNPS